MIDYLTVLEQETLWIIVYYNFFFIFIFQFIKIKKDEIYPNKYEQVNKETFKEISDFN